MPLVFGGPGKALPKTLGKREAQEIGGIPGGFSFGDFSLAKQRKVTRLSGRQIGRIADLHAEHPQGERHGCVS